MNDGTNVLPGVHQLEGVVGLVQGHVQRCPLEKNDEPVARELAPRLSAKRSQNGAAAQPSGSKLPRHRFTERLTSNVLDQPQRIVDSRMGITRRHRVANSEQLEAALRVGHDILGFPGDQIVLLHRAVIARVRA